MIKVYDYNVSTSSPAAILQNAFGISYGKRLNEVWTAQFSMSADDPKVLDCNPYSIVEIFDGDERIELFRIMPSKQNKDAGTNIITFSCEHVLATLLDDLMFQLNIVGGGIYDTADVINFILNKQSTVKWQLYTCNFTRNFEYKWENENLLSALLSVPAPFNAEYQWAVDTTIYPWGLNLLVPSSTIDARILYKKNLIGISKQVDPSNLITRLYGLGYGEGVNQLTISAINAGLPYINASTIGTYGTIARLFTDKRFESAETLKAQMETILEEQKIPRIVYTVNAADIYQITSDTLDKFELGNLVYVNDSEIGISFTSRVVSITKSDLIGNPGNIELQISNKIEDIGDTISKLEVKASTNDNYSQGATNIDSNDYQDNCDNAHPATIEFYLPTETVIVNKCLLTYKTDKFRAYETGAASGGGSAATSSSGGSATPTSSSGGSSTETSTSGGGSTSGASSTSTTDTSTLATYISLVFDTTIDDGTGLHFHGVDASHTHTLPNHDHGMAHTHSVSAHTHDVAIPAHTHTVAVPAHTHDVTIPDHTHAINYGIYEFGFLPPSLVIKVDSTVIPITALTSSDIDIVPYLSLTDGKPIRGAFHKVEIYPDTGVDNPGGLARITAAIVKQVFIQSRGDYSV